MQATPAGNLTFGELLTLAGIYALTWTTYLWLWR